MVPAGLDLRVVYGPSQFRSPENNNIFPGQTFRVIAEFNTKCGVLQTGPLDFPPNREHYFNNGFNQAPKWATEDIVVSYCNGQSYEYTFPVFDEDTTLIKIRDTLNNITVDSFIVRDELSYRLVPALAATGSALYETPGASPSVPFPVSINGGINSTKLEGGVMTFTPNLPFGVKTYTAVVSVEVTEKRKTYKIVPGNGNLELTNFDTIVSKTRREMRFLISDDCNDGLPIIEASNQNWNTAQNAWEFNCRDSVMEFTMTRPMLVSSFQKKATKNEPIVDEEGPVRDAQPDVFTLHRGTIPGIPTEDGLPFDFDYVQMLNCNSEGLFTQFRVKLNRAIGPGRYVMYAVRGSGDNNTMISRCGTELPYFGGPDPVDTIPIFVNDTFDYVFKDKLIHCYSKDKPLYINALKGQKLGKDSSRALLATYAWRGNKFAPKQFNDSVIRFKIEPDDSLRYNLTNTFTTPPDYPITPITDFTSDFWTIGLGLDFSYFDQNQNKVTAGMFCYAEDPDVFITYIEVPQVIFKDIDLCEGEDWPIVRPDIDYTNSNAILNNVNWFAKGTGITPVGSYKPVGGQSNTSGINDSLDLNSFSSGLGNAFEINVELDFDNCPEPVEASFTAIRSNVIVEIGNDSIICEGDQYDLINMIDYPFSSPDSLSYAWFIDGVEVFGATTDTLRITSRGLYKLVVTKRTEKSTCMGEDSVFINVADELIAPAPICSQITFKNGVVEQRFYWDPLVGADGYQVRGVSRDGEYLDTNGLVVASGGWHGSNDDFGIHHKINGEQVKLEVRGVNLEVDSLASCRYGPIGIAEACDVIVKPVNIFTPNGDGINDFMKFDLIELYPGSKLQVFNRWGKLIYESGNYLNDWNGDEHKDGTYFYVLKINDPEGQQGTFTGNVTIVR